MSRMVGQPEAATRSEGDGRVPAPFGRRPAPVIARQEYGAYVVLRCADLVGPVPQPGQFYMLSAADRWGGGEGGRPFLPRAFSVLRARRTGADGVELHFLLEDVGPGTRRLCELGPGEELWLVGPLGRGFRRPGEGRGALLVGGGVGIAPLAIWQDRLKEMAADGTPGRGLVGPVRALLGFRDGDRARGAELLEGATVATDDGSVGHHGLVTELLRDELEDAGESFEVYACGPPAMLESVRRLCAERGVTAQLALESGMACGYGACFGCVVPTRDGYIRLCLDGPVIAAEVLEEVG